MINILKDSEYYPLTYLIISAFVLFFIFYCVKAYFDRSAVKKEKTRQICNMRQLQLDNMTLTELILFGDRCNVPRYSLEDKAHYKNRLKFYLVCKDLTDKRSIIKGIC